MGATHVADSHKLLVWRAPRVRTTAEALSALSLGPARLEKRSELVDFAAAVGQDPRITIDRSMSSPGRLVVVAVERGALANVAALIVGLCELNKLVLFDPEANRLVVPRHDRSRPWPAPEPLALEALRSVVHDAAGSASDVDALNAEVLRSVGGVRLEEAVGLPSPVPVELAVPRSLRFLIPLEVPARRQTKKALATLVAELVDPRPGVRRAAALDLGGWGRAADVNERLRERLDLEDDRYVRAVVALSVAIRRADKPPAIVEAVEEVIKDAIAHEQDEWAGLAASIALLAAAIAASHDRSTTICGRVRDIARLVSSIAAERDRARAIDLALAEHCASNP